MAAWADATMISWRDIPVGEGLQSIGYRHDTRSPKA